MADNQVVMRVLLSADTKISIAFEDRRTVPCTCERLRSFLMDPFRFYETQARLIAPNTRFVNPHNLPVNDIPGITLAYVDRDKKTVIFFCELMRQFFFMQRQHKMEVQMSLRDLFSQDRLADEKQFLIRFFMEFGDKFTKKFDMERRLNLSSECQAEILREVANALYSKLPAARTGFVEQDVPHEDFEAICDDAPMEEDVLLLPSEPDPVEDDDQGIPPGLVTIVEYAKLSGYAVGTIRVYINNGKIKNVYRGKGGKIYLDPNEIIDDLRAGRQVKVLANGTGRKNITLKGSSYEDLQVYIHDRKLVTDVLRPFFRTRDEIKFYEKRHYHEVHWPDNQNAMIIDVNPDYIVESKGLSNRDLMMNGEAPICVLDGQPYHLHHISQRADAPLAIIPASVHDSKEYFSILHPGASADRPIDRRKFEVQKKHFWRTYIEMYDKAGSFRRIPYENSKHKKDQR